MKINLSDLKKAVSDQTALKQDLNETNNYSYLVRNSRQITPFDKNIVKKFFLF